MGIDRLSVTYIDGNVEQKAIAERIEELARSKGRFCLVDTVWIDPGHPGDAMPLLKVDGYYAGSGWEVEDLLNNGHIEKALDAA